MARVRSRSFVARMAMASGRTRLMSSAWISGSSSRSWIFATCSCSATRRSRRSSSIGSGPAGDPLSSSRSPPFPFSSRALIGVVAGGTASRSLLCRCLQVVREPHGEVRQQARECRAVGLPVPQFADFLRESGRRLLVPEADLLGQRLGLIEDLLAELPLGFRRHFVQLRDPLVEVPGSVAELLRYLLGRLGPLLVLGFQPVAERLDLLLDEVLERLESLLRLRARVARFLQQTFLEPR